MRLEVPILQVAAGFTDVSPNKVVEEMAYEALVFDIDHAKRYSVVFDVDREALVFASALAHIAEMFGFPCRIRRYSYYEDGKVICRVDTFVPFKLKEEVMKENVLLQYAETKTENIWTVSYLTFPDIWKDSNVVPESP